jgi:hypothetical protein
MILSCSALRFSAAARNSGATEFGSTSFWAKVGSAKATSKMGIECQGSLMRMFHSQLQRREKAKSRPTTVPCEKLSGWRPITRAAVPCAGPKNRHPQSVATCRYHLARRILRSWALGHARGFTARRFAPPPNGARAAREHADGLACEAWNIHLDEIQAIYAGMKQDQPA